MKLLRLYVRFTRESGHSGRSSKGIVTPEAAEIAALPGFAPAPTWFSGTALVLGYGDDQPPLRYCARSIGEIVGEQLR